MNQKEYELIAEVFTAAKNIKFERDNDFATVDHVALDLADKLEITYPKTFDRNKFLKACGVSV